jgi:hypothetical protein
LSLWLLPVVQEEICRAACLAGIELPKKHTDGSINALAVQVVTEGAF